MDKDMRHLDGLALHRTAQLLSQAERAVTRRLAALLEQEGCTIEQWRILTLLSDGRSRAMTELAEFALVPAPSLTRLVDRMVADNLLYRKADPGDRRRVLVRVTERGERLQRRLELRMERDHPLASVAENHLVRLNGLLSGIIDRLQAT